MQSLPRKRSFVYTDQFNLKITKDLKESMRFIAGHGVEVADLVRPLIEKAIADAKEQVIREQAG